MAKTFSYNVKVYYEDTDAGGVVYYANYLKFLERARSEAIYSLGFSNTKIKDKYGLIIVVKSCNIEYKKSAELEDNLNILSSIKIVSKTSFVMIQKIQKKEHLIASAEICLVAVNSKGKPTRIPNELVKLMTN